MRKIGAVTVYTPLSAENIFKDIQRVFETVNNNKLYIQSDCKVILSFMYEWPDLTNCDIFLWVWLKYQTYYTK